MVDRPDPFCSFHHNYVTVSEKTREFGGSWTIVTEVHSLTATKAS